MIIPKINDRKNINEVTAALQAAFDDAANKDEPVLLTGKYITNKPLTARGVQIVGAQTLGAHRCNWSGIDSLIWSGQGPAVIYGQHSGDILTLGLSAANRPSSIQSVGFVGYHETNKNPVGAGIRLLGDSVKQPGYQIQDVVTLYCGVGLSIDPFVMGCRINDVSLFSSRTAGLQCLRPVNTTDNDFGGRVYISGLQRPDIGSAKTAAKYAPFGIQALPVSSRFNGTLLVEDSAVMIHAPVVCNQKIATAFLDHVQGVGLEVGNGYSDTQYSSELYFGSMHMQAPIEPTQVDAVRFIGTLNGPRATLTATHFATSNCGAGSFKALAGNPKLAFRVGAYTVQPILR